MPSQAVERQDEVLITRGAPAAVARAIQRRARAGALVKIAEGVYVRETERDGQVATARRHWARVVAALVPNAVVSYRSAFAGGPSAEGVLFLSHPSNFNRTIKLPGLRVVLVKGPNALAGDMPLGNERLFCASRPRQLLENLAPQRGARGKSAGAKAVEERLVSILDAAGEAELHRIRDAAQGLAGPLGLDVELRKLDAIVGALLATRVASAPKTRPEGSVAQATPSDAARLARFEILAARLRAEPLPRRAATATAEPDRSNFAFLESYFSSHVEGSELSIDEARDVVLRGRLVAEHSKDSQGVLGVFRLALESPWRDTVPPFGADFPAELARRHAQMLAQRPESGPGRFKVERNRAGGTWFVDPALVRGTLIEGSTLARSVPEGLARAIYYAFLVSEVHPFASGNGRLARLVMNAELARAGEARIIIPTLFHWEYVDCQRQLSREDDPNGLVRALTLMQAWTSAFDYSDIDALIAAVTRTHAFERSRSQFIQLLMPDGTPLAS